MMKLKNILHYIGLLFFFIFSLLGGLLKGYDPLVALPISLVLTIVVFFLVRLMINKKKETHTKIIETLSHWLIYIVIMVAGGIASLHFITVQFIAADDLKNSGNAKLKTVADIYETFKDQKENEAENLKGILKSKLNEYKNSSRSEKKKLEVELLDDYKIDEEDLTSTSLTHDRIKKIKNSKIDNYFTKQIDVLSSKYLDSLDTYYKTHKHVFNNMQSNYRNIKRVYCDDLSLSSIRLMKEELEKRFNQVASKFGKDVDIFSNLTMPSSDKEVSLDNFDKLRKQYPPWKYLGLYLLLHLLIISPLLLAWREGKKPLSEKDIYTKEL